MASRRGDISKSSRNVIEIQDKIKIIEMSDAGTRTCDISRAFNLAWSTVNTILRNKEKYKAAAKNDVSVRGKLLKPRNEILVQMEEQLNCWIKQKRKLGYSVNSYLISEQAKKLFGQFKLKNPECKLEFVASVAWYKRFINRTSKPIPQIEDSEVEIETNSGEDYLPTIRDPPAVKCTLCFREVFVSC
jgi:hypothetical protein